MPFIDAPPFTEYENNAILLKDIFTLLEGLIIFFQVFHAFTHPVNREHFEQVQYPGKDLLFECISPGKGVNRFIKQGAEYDGIQEGVGMIDRKQQRPFVV